MLKHFLLSETKNDDVKVTRRTCSVRQCYFNKFHVDKNNPAPRHAHSRKVTVEIVDVKFSLCLRTLCYCGYVQRCNHACRHYQCMTNAMPTSEFCHPKLWKSYFKLMHVDEEHTKIVEEHDVLR